MNRNPDLKSEVSERNAELAKGFKELEHKPEARGLEHAEWLGLLLEYELTPCSAIAAHRLLTMISAARFAPAPPAAV